MILERIKDFFKYKFYIVYLDDGKYILQRSDGRILHNSRIEAATFNTTNEIKKEINFFDEHYDERDHGEWFL